MASLAVRVTVQGVVFPFPSSAVTVTSVVAPSAKASVFPAAGLCVKVTVPQLSIPVKPVLKSGMVISQPTSRPTTSSAGQVNVGAMASLAVRVTVQGVVFPFPSSAVTVTSVVAPSAKASVFPAAGLCVKVTVPQLSIPVKPVLKSGMVISQSTSRPTTSSAGQVNVGAMASLAVRVTVQGVVFPFPSSAVTVTSVVAPSAKASVFPAAGLCVKVTVPQLSIPVKPVLKSGMVISQSTSRPTTSSAGQVNVGAMASLAVRVTVQGVVFPFPSSAVTVTSVVAPSAKASVFPAAGLCVKVTVPQLSIPVKPVIKSGMVISQSTSRLTTSSAGQVNVGGVTSGLKLTETVFA